MVDMTKDKETFTVSLALADAYVTSLTGRTPRSHLLRKLVEWSVLPTYSRKDDAARAPVLFARDLQSIASFLVAPEAPPCLTPRIGPQLVLLPDTQLPMSARPSSSLLGDGFTVSAGDASPDMTVGLGAAIRNLIVSTGTDTRKFAGQPTVGPYIAGSTITTSSAQCRTIAAQQVERARRVSRPLVSELAGSANYMGSKRELAQFLVEVMSAALPHDDGVVVDLMCGSGAAARAFAEHWRTVASDAQQFCRALAVVQGGGFSAGRATAVADRVVDISRENSRHLLHLLKPHVDREDAILYGDLGPALLREYGRFAQEFPVYPSSGERGSWDPAAEIRCRQANPSRFPYCLFTAYFANTYLGLRQSIEVDSVRYGIEQLCDPAERQWALGALVAAVSAVATTYAGHFAQPKSVNADTLADVLNTRSQSVTHEFRMRLEGLGQESERGRRPVEDVPGPWRHALSSIEPKMQEVPVAVYLDAPYKRDEYSRYYHVLETLVSYAYPSTVGRGRIPDKRTGDRFSSEFFTRSRDLVEERLSRVISEVLRRGWTCCWSYSDAGQADIVSVAQMVRASTPCDLTSYSTRHRHRSQGKSEAKPEKRQSRVVTEYVLVFAPLD